MFFIFCQWRNQDCGMATVYCEECETDTESYNGFLGWNNQRDLRLFGEGVRRAKIST